MSLQRSYTRFGVPRGAPRGATPDSDYSSNGTASIPTSPDNGFSNKLRKRPWAGQGDEPPRKIRPPSQSVMPKEPNKGPHTTGSEKTDDSLPSESLTMHFTLFLEDPVIIASRRGALVAVKKSSSKNADRKLNMLELVQHDTFIKFLHCITTEDAHYFIFEHDLPGNEGRLSVTLSNLVTSPVHITEPQLKVLLRPILDGIEYLALMGLEHGSIKCTNILIGTLGSIRIARQECCRKLVSSRNSDKDIKGVGYVAMALMNKEEVYSGSMGVHDTRRWPLEGAASQFILCAESATSFDDLKKPLMTDKKKEKENFNAKEDEMAKMANMMALVYVAEISTYRGYTTKVDENDVDDKYIDDK
ncbi:hypothetical protein V496_03331 [Pseudogymnoascus sp. VKM F-4515 (FW-2607)]|nr:hypothetical protein V496_03331 [Pseudogymnoascus sp. VKM F-4515 (FW-2607)]